MSGFDFISKWKLWFAISGAFLILSVAAILVQGIQFGIEFKGGTIIEWEFEKKVSLPRVRDALRPLRLSDVPIQPLGDKGVLIRGAEMSSATQEKVEQALKKLGGGQAVLVDSVGAAWGEQITRSSLTALAFSIVGILLFISIRLDFKMALASVAALAHDVVITLGVYAIAGADFTPATVAALLTVLGYSLYDTIVVFHRIQENVPGLSRQTYSAMVNMSLHQVLVRSLNTTITTLLPIVTLFLIGGETLKDFAFALLVGIGLGAYSSIFLAAPLIALWKEKEDKYIALRKRLARKAAAQAS